jgi:hypothetical protein
MGTLRGSGKSGTVGSILCGQLLVWVGGVFLAGAGRLRLLLAAGILMACFIGNISLFLDTFFSLSFPACLFDSSFTVLINFFSLLMLLPVGTGTTTTTTIIIIIIIIITWLGRFLNMCVQPVILCLSIQHEG